MENLTEQGEKAKKELSRSEIQFGMLSKNEKARGRRSETGWTLWIMLCQTYPTFIRQVALKKSKESLGLMLKIAEISPNQQHIQKEDKASQTIEASNAVTTRTLNKYKTSKNKGVASKGKKPPGVIVIQIALQAANPRQDPKTHYLRQNGSFYKRKGRLAEHKYSFRKKC
ncbi:hypothetical protein TSAR_015598 [Trichomalopsis sarcophagae]|uniref:Uncharacterized protein n=1 Tax=Trichomalopsis sarcophagae TaxID=543379 RepID=A0A232ELX6_9HYME|nr:hypothetical protein TSAR_015598 [Trichomalopsis sarcophagae]